MPSPPKERDDSESHLRHLNRKKNNLANNELGKARKRGFKYWLSWVGVLPISIIAGVLVTFPIHWFLYATLSGGQDPFITPYPELPEKVLSPFFVTFVIVLVGSLVAPQFKFTTAIILTMILVFLAGANFVLGYIGYRYQHIQLNLTAGGLPIIMSAIGAIFSLIVVKTMLDQDEKTI